MTPSDRTILRLAAGFLRTGWDLPEEARDELADALDLIVVRLDAPADLEAYKMGVRFEPLSDAAIDRTNEAMRRYAEGQDETGREWTA